MWILFLASTAVITQALADGNLTPCIPISARNSSVDDVPAISEALAQCGNGGTIIIPAREIFTIRSPLDFGRCQSCHFQIEGTLKVSDDLTYWEGKTAFFLLTNISGATFESLTGSGLIDGSGQKYWDYFASNKTYRRPLLVRLSHTSNLNIRKLNLRNPPFWFFFVTDTSTNITFSDLSLTAISVSENKPANTDGFDTGDASYITIRHVHVTNGDDCVSFKNGSNYITVENITCIGSHGLSVGSLGSDAGHSYIVQNVYVSNAKMINCTLGVRIKFYPGGPAYGTVLVRNVTYNAIMINNTDDAFQVDNCYESDPNICKINPSAAQLLDISIMNVQGETSKKYDPVVARISGPPVGICDLTFMHWNIQAPSGKATVLCNHYDHPHGITCTPNPDQYHVSGDGRTIWYDRSHHVSQE